MKRKVGASFTGEQNADHPPTEPHRGSTLDKPINEWHNYCKTQITILRCVIQRRQKAQKQSMCQEALVSILFCKRELTST